MTKAIGFIILIIAGVSSALLIFIITYSLLSIIGTTETAPLRNVIFISTNLLGHILLFGAGIILLRRKDRVIYLYIAGLGILTLSVSLSSFPDVGEFLPLGLPAILIYVILGIGLLLGKSIEIAHNQENY